MFWRLWWNNSDNRSAFWNWRAELGTPGQFIVLLHPGSSSAARDSAATHTGAMAGDYEVMQTLVPHAGVIHVESMEELVDVTQILVRSTELPTRRCGNLHESGAFKALTLDLCDRIGLELPGLSAEAEQALRASASAIHSALESARSDGAGTG